MESIDSENIGCENPLFLIFNNVDGYIIEESNEDKYFIFSLTKNNKKVLGKYIKLCNEIKNQIETMNGGKPIKYKKDFMKIRFYSADDDLLLGRIISTFKCVIVIASVLRYNNKCYPQVCIHESEYKL